MKSSPSEVVGHVPKWSQGFWVVAEIWKWIDNHEGVKGLIAAVIGGKHDVLLLRYYKIQECKSNRRL